MPELEQPYLDLLRDILDHGQPKGDRTGTGTLSVFGRQMRFDLAQPGPAGGFRFPVLTTKKLHLRSIIHELLWFLRGDTNVAYLREHNVTIWDEWADERGDLGPVYGKQWRRWQTPDGRVIDQVASVVEQIKTNPDSRRLIVSAWNVADIDRMKLPPCHLLFQFYVSPPSQAGPCPQDPDSSAPTAHAPAPPRRLSCQLYQRSADAFLGVPFNIASYALLTLMVAQVCGLAPGEFIHTFGDLHLYNNHLDQAREQLARTPRPAPVMTLNPTVTDLFAFTFDDFALTDYDPHPAIKAKVAV